MIPDPVLTALTTNASRILGNVIGTEINKQMFVSTEVKRLKVNYEQIMMMIKKAEQTATIVDDEANHWMKRIKDHMYDVEDIVDIWMIKVEKRRSIHGECETGSLQSSFISCKNVILRSKIYTSIKNLNEDFENILKLSLAKMPDDRIIRSYGKTAPDYNAEITGDYVQKDCDAITKLLIDCQSTCRLIAIVGMVGIGKTTLARKIYHSILTGEHEAFDIKLWIRFSKDLSSLIMWSDSRKEDATKAQLQQLGRKIAQKTFLLVIDDVWTENVWETLLEGPLHQGNRGSKVIVTTRHKHVAKRIGAGHIHYVKRMNAVDAWRLLRQRASVNQNDEAELWGIGQQIVEKCDGLPLAIRSIGRALRGREPTRHDWENVHRTAFQDFSPEEQYIINLSFQDLPSHMRQCFLYCSIFPEGFLIEKQYITQHWISEGFIIKKRKSTLEEIAEDCYDELIGRGLLQLEFGTDSLARARMPIIIRSFASDVSDHENFCNELVSADILFEPRRLSFVEGNNQQIDDVRNDENYGTSAILEIFGGTNEANNQYNEEFGNAANNGARSAESNQDGGVENGDNSGGSTSAGNGDSRNHCSQEVSNGANNCGTATLYGLRSMKSLRTLILCKSKLSDGILADTFKQLTLLRVLDLHKTNIEILPATIGRLEHLRYLNLSDTLVKRVPGTIGSLRMLQYLLLKNCKLKKYPRSIEVLQNLRCLDISGTGLDDIRWNFDHMEELSSIHGFYLKNDGVQKLLKLRFPRKLTTLQNVDLDKAIELPAGIESPLRKLHLKELDLCYTSNYDEEPYVTYGNLEKTKRVLDRLRPHECLVSLKIENYPGDQYPSWISRPALRNLQRLHLQNCLLCKKLPALGDLPQLKFLAITCFDKLETLGVEPRTICAVAFPKLEQLQIDDMKMLHRLLDVEGQHLQCLQRLSILNCPNLTTIPHNLKESMTLTRLQIDKETSVGLKKMLQEFREGIVLIAGKAMDVHANTGASDEDGTYGFRGDSSAVIEANAGASGDGTHDLDTNEGASGHGTHDLDTNAVASGDDGIHDIHDVAALAGDANEDDLGDGVGGNAAPPVQCDIHGVDGNAASPVQCDTHGVDGNAAPPVQCVTHGVDSNAVRPGALWTVTTKISNQLRHINRISTNFILAACVILFLITCAHSLFRSVHG